MRSFALFVAIFGVFAAVGMSARAAEPETALFAGGCFWCMQPPFDHLDGVIETSVGFAGGTSENPKYQDVAAGKTNHREVIQVKFDPEVVSYAELLEVFWHQINPVQENGQFADLGQQYRTAIYYSGPEQKRAAEQSKEALDASGKFQQPVVTEILPATKFWPAEEYHQKYYLKNPTHYKAYKKGSGREGYLKKTWGATDS